MMKKKKRIAGLIGMVLLLNLLLCGCSGIFEDTGISYIDTTTDVSTLSDKTIGNIAKNVTESMTLNEKVGQLFVVDLSLLEPSKKSVKAEKLSKKMKKSLQLYPVGGVILYSKDIRTPKQTKRLIANLQKQSRAKLFVCVDEEGGMVSRIASNSRMKEITLPSMYQIGQTKDTANAYQAGIRLGKQLKRLGFNVNFAPVADVLSPDAVQQDTQNYTDASELANDAEIGSRSFGTEADLVAKMVAQEVKGMKQEKIGATLKHFPGQGSASSDTHISSANVSKTIDQLRKSDFKPFKSGIKEGAGFVMLSHESVNTVTGNSTPACMSSLIVKDILKEELGFKGIIITDAMNMKSITAQYSSADAAINVIRAGVDIILMPQDLEDAYNGVMQAVEKKKISEERLDRSVRKIIKYKIKQGILPLTSDMVVKASQESYDNYQTIEKK